MILGFNPKGPNADVFYTHKRDAHGLNPSDLDAHGIDAHWFASLPPLSILVRIVMTFTVVTPEFLMPMGLMIVI